MTTNYKISTKDNCKGCASINIVGEGCIYSINNYKIKGYIIPKIGLCPCRICIVKMVCLSSCEDYAEFRNSVYKTYCREIGDKGVNFLLDLAIKHIYL